MENTAACIILILTTPKLHTATCNALYVTCVTLTFWNHLGLNLSKYYKHVCLAVVQEIS